MYCTHFLSALGLGCLKKTQIRLELLTDIDILLLVEKGIRGEMRYAINAKDMQRQIIST